MHRSLFAFYCTLAAVQRVDSFAPPPGVVRSSPRRRAATIQPTTTLQERPWPSSDDVGSAGEATQRLGGPNSNPTVWTEFARMAGEYQSNFEKKNKKNTDDNSDDIMNPLVNLGQGFPDWLPPKFAIDSLVEAALDASSSPHQYTRTAGHPKLVNQLAARYSRHLNRDIHPMNQVAVTIGASQALYLSLQTIVQPGDEVILFEPFFDLYVNQIKLAGGTPVYVPLKYREYKYTSPERNQELRGGEWLYDSAAFLNAISPNTKAVVLNSPHNPTGKLFTRDELESIARIVKKAAPKHCVVLSDEVYKYIVHSTPPKQEITDNDDSTSTTTSSQQLCPGHVHFASLPGMWERTITISSAGKTFSATGWQVGWCIGPSHLIARIQQLLPYVQFCASTVMQEALARALPKADLPFTSDHSITYDSYYHYLRAMYTRKRDLLASALQAAGFAVPNYAQTPGGGFFIFARIQDEHQQDFTTLLNCIPPNRVNVPNAAAPTGIARADWALCQWMIEEKGLLCIPASPFFAVHNNDAKEEELTTAAAEDDDDDGQDTGDNKSVVVSPDQFIRVAFCKSDDTIQAAAERLQEIAVDECTLPKEVTTAATAELSLSVSPSSAASL